MKLDNMKNAVTSKVARQVLIGKKHSPTLLFAAGVVGVAGTVVLACRATLKVEHVLNDAEKEMLDARSNRELVHVRARTMVKVTQLYAPSVVLGVASVGALTGSHVVLNRRNVALTAAYKTIDEAFQKYRDRVIADLGEDKDREYRYDIREVEVHDTKKGVVQKKNLVHMNGASQYARLFDEMNPNWSPQPEYNLIFLRAQQTYANQLLNARGHVFLNDIYDALGIDRSKEGAVVGWVKNGEGDNYIDFGCFDGEAMDSFYDFVVGNEDSLWLDFNVDGIVYDKI